MQSWWVHLANEPGFEITDWDAANNMPTESSETMSLRCDSLFHWGTCGPDEEWQKDRKHLPPNLIKKKNLFDTKREKSFHNAGFHKNELELGPALSIKSDTCLHHARPRWCSSYVTPGGVGRGCSMLRGCGTDAPQLRSRNHDLMTNNRLRRVYLESLHPMRTSVRNGGFLQPFIRINQPDVRKYVRRFTGFGHSDT